MRELDAWKKVFRDLDPLRILEPHEVATLYAHRPDSASEEIADEITIATAPEDMRILLAGARGTGKTTELLRLRSRFERGVHVVVPAYVDIAAILPEHASTRTWLPLLAVALRAVRASWSPPPPVGDRLLRALGELGFGKDQVSSALAVVGHVAHWFRKPITAGASAAATAGAASYGVADSGAAGTAAAVATDEAITRLAALTSPRAEALKETGTIDELLSAMREDVEAVTDAAGKPVLLLLDGLDKRRSAESVLDALDEAELLYRLPAALVVSGPVQLSMDARFAAQLLPGNFRCVVHHNLPVVDEAGGPKAQGIDVLVDLFARRWTAMGLPGPSVLPEPLVREAARWSSGIVREFLEIARITTRYAWKAGRDVAEPTDLEGALRDRRMDYGRTVTHELWNELARVLQSRERPRAELDELLFTNRIACYPNGETWFRPHELLVPHLLARHGGEVGPE